MAADDRILRLHSHGGTTARRIIELLADTEYAYNGIVAFDAILAQRDRVPSNLPPDWSLRSWHGRPFPKLLLSRDEVASLVHPRWRLRVDAVRLESPGFWDFLGKSISVDALSQAVTERQQRREFDRQLPHRERMEQVEEFEGVTGAILNRHGALKEMGASDAELASLRNQLVERPLDAFARHVEAGLIEDVETLDPEERKELPPGETSA
jgi:hypothetical protein